MCVLSRWPLSRRLFYLPSMWMWVRSSFVPLSFSISILAFFQYMLRKLDH